MGRPIDTINAFAVGGSGTQLVALGLRTIDGHPLVLDALSAKELAAWLVVVAEAFEEDGTPTFDEVRAAIENT